MAQKNPKVLAFLVLCALKTFDGTVTHYFNGTKKMWSMNWVCKGQWSLNLVHGDGPCTSTMKWGSFLCTHPKFNFIIL